MNEILTIEIARLSQDKEGPFSPIYFDILGEESRVTIDALQGIGFFKDPASCRYHGSWERGLAQHSLRVLHHVLRIYKDFCPGTNARSMVYGTLFHDICKAGSYEVSTRNVKKNGMWVQEPYFANVPDLPTMGHGAESCRRIDNLGIKLTEGWYMAVRWHMGAYDLSDSDKYAHMAAMKKYPEVLLLQTADLMAGIIDNI